MAEMDFDLDPPMAEEAPRRPRRRVASEPPGIALMRDLIDLVTTGGKVTMTITLSAGQAE